LTKLSDLIAHDFDADPEIAGVTADSRKVRPGFVFAALPGAAADGRAFIPQALAAGAVAIIAAEDTADVDAPLLRTPDPRRVYALAAKAFWGAQPETVVAVTGTNGKTSVATFCRQIFARLGRTAGSMGTLGVTVGTEEIVPPGLTTPDAADVAELLASLEKRGVTHLALEASSHGVEQKRLDGVTLTAAAFTNLSQDHLDYHGTMASYLHAKLALFDRLLPRGAPAVLNADDEACRYFAAAASQRGQRVLTVGEAGTFLRLVGCEATPEGQTLTIEAEEAAHTVRLPLVGAFQASNALVAAGLCAAAGEPVAAVLAALEHLEGARGRLERVGPARRGGEAYVDYAHTPEGLATVLEALRPHARGRLIAVIGAGGDRDRGKRAGMGEAAARLADFTIVTDDNPRSEDPADIRCQVLAGAPGALEIGDRREAIREAASMLRDGDVLVVAGKGHEQGQIVGGVVHPFDDATEVARALEAACG